VTFALGGYPRGPLLATGMSLHLRPHGTDMCVRHSRPHAGELLDASVGVNGFYSTDPQLDESALAIPCGRATGSGPHSEKRSYRNLARSPPLTETRQTALYSAHH
jgi:hypothetical protein